MVGLCVVYSVNGPQIHLNGYEHALSSDALALLAHLDNQWIYEADSLIGNVYISLDFFRFETCLSIRFLT